MLRWTGLAPWEFELLFPGSLTFKEGEDANRSARVPVSHKLCVLGNSYMGTSLARKRTPLGSYRKPIPRVLGGS
jgi:hypothetical protein